MIGPVFRAAKAQIVEGCLKPSSLKGARGVGLAQESNFPCFEKRRMLRASELERERETF